MRSRGLAMSRSKRKPITLTLGLALTLSTSAGSPGPNVFAIESAIDECARHVGADAVRFRRDHAEGPRLVRVLERAAAAAGGGTARPGAASRRRRGVACGIYEAMSYAAVVAEVEIDASGTVRVTRLVCGRGPSAREDRAGLLLDVEQQVAAAGGAEGAARALRL
jgi:CO/xanthine dehydrogenase Mo-binding subunit